MSKSLRIAVVIAVTSIPVLAAAHGMPPAPLHGGRVLEANENWVELVITGDRVQIYVLDETRKPVPASKLAGTVTVLSAGMPYKVKLTPGAANELDAGLPIAAGAGDAAAVSLRIDGQREAARYPARS